jgi:hypothetical protein
VWPFVKGALLPPPAFMALGAVSLFVLNATGDAPFLLFIFGFIGAVAGFGLMTVKRWSSARPFAVGMLVSLILCVLALGGFALLVVMAAGAGMRG